MGMSTSAIVTNLQGMNANRQLGIVTDRKAKSTEKLSSGYRINRAADDAAGLAISEKMRRQIRGFRQGMDNIMEGVGLVQTADGALGEITDVLQRINELSIKAYNDTNSDQDRSYIQSEVDQLLGEIERCARDTSFNEKPLFQGNPMIYGKLNTENMIHWVPSEDDEPMIRSIPDWMTVSDSFNSSNSSALTSKQDPNQFFIRKISPSDDEYDAENPGAIKYLYWGKDQNSCQSSSVYQNTLKNQNGELGDVEFIYKGRLTEELQNNASMTIDYAGLKNASNTPEELFENLKDLIGCSIGVPCATCNSEYYGVTFTGMAKELDSDKITVANADSFLGYSGVSHEYSTHTKSVDLTSYFENISALAKNTDLSETERNAKAKEMAQTIAEKLAEKTIGCAGRDHFNRDARESATSVVIYDYRDDDALTENLSMPIMTSATSRMLVPQEDEDQYGLVEEPMLIQCSSNNDDFIEFDYPLINLDSLGIRGYDISKYGMVQVTPDITHEEKQVIHHDSVTKQETYMEYHDDIDDNGETIRVGVKKTRNVTYPAYDSVTTKTVVDKPGDRAYGYDPDDVALIRDALKIVSSERARLGAIQNRLEHAFNSNGNKHENTQAAESLIRDTDMAREMVTQSKENILQQAGQTMLAQANQNRQGILQLLQ